MPIVNAPAAPAPARDVIAVTAALGELDRAVAAAEQAAKIEVPGKGRPTVPMRTVSLADACGIVHAAGGLAVWAHPAAAELETQVDAFRERGIDGVECIRSRATPVEIERALALTRDRGLMPTGGSDWHGVWQGRLGDFTIGADRLPEFIEQLDGRIPA